MTGYAVHSYWVCSVCRMQVSTGDMHYCSVRPPDKQWVTQKTNEPDYVGRLEGKLDRLIRLLEELRRDP